MILFLGISVINVYSKNKKEYYLNVQSDLLKVKYDTSYKYFRIMAEDIALMYTNNKKLTSLLSQALKANDKKKALIRKKVYKSLLRNYKRLNNMGISQVHFHFPNNISFLRMYKPEVFGDDVSSIKNSVVLTNQTQKEHAGFETCLFMAGLRFVYPLFDAKKKHIGSVEIAYSTKELLKSITDDFVYDSHILISKTIADGTIVEQELHDNYKLSWENPKYYIEENTHKYVGDKNLYAIINTNQMLNSIARGIKIKRAFSVATVYNYQNIIISFLPLFGADTHTNVAYIVTYTESDYLSNLKIQKNYILALFITVLVLFYLFGLYVMNAQFKLKELALYDNLTKLPNRALFMIEFNNEINRALRYEHNIALLFLDLDGFKAVNDTYGHQIGDKLLVYVADTITSRLRKNDIVSRLGGDEFTVILNDIQTAQDAVDLAKNIIDDINKDIILNHEILHVGVSIGIAMYPEHSKKVEELIKFSDKMMYVSKENGKNRVTLYKEKKENV